MVTDHSDKHEEAAAEYNIGFMRKSILLPLILMIGLLYGCGNGQEAAQSSATADPAAQVVGNWKLDLPSVKFKPTPEAEEKLKASTPGAVAALEEQLKKQLSDQLGDAVWTFNQDKTAEIKLKSGGAKGTWSISGRDLLLKTDQQPEAKMKLSEDGRHITAEMPGENGSITLGLIKS